MKILQILEAQFAKPQYAYHATKAEHIPSILKHGLIPNKREGGYGSADTSTIGIPLTPLSGTYLTYSAKDAKYISYDVGGNDGGIVVICKVQNRAADLDEDRMEKIIDLRQIFSWFVKELKAKNFKPFTEDQIAQYATKKADEILEQPTFFKSDLKMIDALRPALIDHLKVFLTYVQQNQLDQEHMGFDQIKNTQNILTKKMKTLAHKNTKDFHTFKIDHPIGFSGANKIVGLYNPNTNIGWGDIGDFDGEQYHIAKDPRRVLTK